MRLTPALVFMLVGVSALRTFSGMDIRETFKFAVVALFYSTNIWSIRRSGGYWGPFSNTWSLAVEEHFYILWALLLPWLLKCRVSVRITLLASLIALSWGIRYYSCYGQGQSIFGEWYISGPSNFFRMLFGTVLHLVPTPSWIRNRLMAHIGVAMVFCNIVIACVWKFDHRLQAVFLTPFTLLATLFIIAGTEGEGKGFWLLEGRIVRFLGKISYAWYLWQFPILLYSGWNMSYNNWADTGFALCAAMLSTFMLEDPIRKWYRARMAGRIATPSLPV
jgi:peptidoglycan/LPS O-acetylase OafA/YrhL